MVYRGSALPYNPSSTLKHSIYLIPLLSDTLGIKSSKNMKHPLLLHYDIISFLHKIRISLVKAIRTRKLLTFLICMLTKISKPGGGGVTVLKVKTITVWFLQPTEPHGMKKKSPNLSIVEHYDIDIQNSLSWESILFCFSKTVKVQEKITKPCSSNLNQLIIVCLAWIMIYLPLKSSFPSFSHKALHNAIFFLWNLLFPY